MCKLFWFWKCFSFIFVLSYLGQNRQSFTDWPTVHGRGKHRVQLRLVAPTDHASRRCDSNVTTHGFCFVPWCNRRNVRPFWRKTFPGLINTANSFWSPEPCGDQAWHVDLCSPLATGPNELDSCNKLVSYKFFTLNEEHCCKSYTRSREPKGQTTKGTIKDDQLFKVSF